MLKKILESSLTARRSSQSILKEINPDIHWKENAEAAILWPPAVKSRLIGKDPGAGKDRGQEEKKRVTEDEMVGWHH